MRQLVPRLGERVRELLRMFEEALRNRPVDRVHPQRKVGGEHAGSYLLRRIVRRWNRARSTAVLGRPLVRARRTLGQLPLIAVEILEIVVAPLHRRRGPRHFNAAGDRVRAFARAEAVLPAEALLLDRSALGLRAD